MTSDGPIELSRLQLVQDQVRAEVWRAEYKHRDEAMTSPVHGDGKRLSILVEEVGEVGSAMTYDKGSRANLREELIQVAAMATAWVYAMDTQDAESKSQAG
jgi:hypothetical protein